MVSGRVRGISSIVRDMFQRPDSYTIVISVLFRRRLILSIDDGPLDMILFRQHLILFLWRGPILPPMSIGNDAPFGTLGRV